RLALAHGLGLREGEFQAPQLLGDVEGITGEIGHACAMFTLPVVDHRSFSSGLLRTLAGASRPRARLPRRPRLRGLAIPTFAHSERAQIRLQRVLEPRGDVGPVP